MRDHLTDERGTARCCARHERTARAAETCCRKASCRRYQAAACCTFHVVGGSWPTAGPRDRRSLSARDNTCAWRPGRQALPLHSVNAFRCRATAQPRTERSRGDKLLGHAARTRVRDPAREQAERAAAKRLSGSSVVPADVGRCFGPLDPLRTGSHGVKAGDTSKSWLSTCQLW
eukprot:366550-Chlamydomonas_euryale.AAC.7